MQFLIAFVIVKSVIPTMIGINHHTNIFLTITLISLDVKQSKSAINQLGVILDCHQACNRADITVELHSLL